MKSELISFGDLFVSPNVSYEIPVYQRSYDWSTKECDQLLADILRAGKSSHIHFIGTIVIVKLKSTKIGSPSNEILIDGQQRLTTLLLVLYIQYCKIKPIVDGNSKNSNNESEEFAEFVKFLKIALGIRDEKIEPTIKLKKNDAAALQSIYYQHELEDDEVKTNIAQNYHHLKEKMRDLSWGDLLNGLNSIKLVRIIIEKEEDENPQQIFESLNSTGKDLSQGDLIRNYLLMSLEPKVQKKFYSQYFETIEKKTFDEIENQNRLSAFIRDFLTFETKQIPVIDNVYWDFKEQYPDLTVQKLEELLQKMMDLSYGYECLNNPAKEKNKDIRRHLEYIRLLKVKVCYPFLMKVYSDFRKEIIQPKEFIDILQFIQSYCVRRFVMGLNSNALNKVFMNLYQEVNLQDYVASIQRAILQRGPRERTRFPSDEEVREQLQTRDIYSNLNSSFRRYIFERLENYQRDGYLDVSDLTIEHIFPQRPVAQWQKDLGKDGFEWLQKHLHTIGNLTLCKLGSNSTLNNRTFLFKRDLKDQGYRYGGLWLNEDLSKFEKWTKEEYTKRLERITRRFLKIWFLPQIVTDMSKEESVNIMQADSPRGKTLDFCVFKNETKKIHRITELYLFVFQELYQMDSEKCLGLKLSESAEFFSKNKESLRSPQLLGDSWYIETNLDSNTKFRLLKAALTQFGMNNDLYIKYSPFNIQKFNEKDGNVLSVTKALRLEFWEKFADSLQKTGEFSSIQTPAPRSYFDVHFGFGDMIIGNTFSISKKQVRVCIYIYKKGAKYVPVLSRNKLKIENSISEPMQWKIGGEGKDSVISVCHDVEPHNNQSILEAIKWMTEMNCKLKKIVSKIMGK